MDEWDARAAMEALVEHWRQNHRDKPLGAWLLEEVALAGMGSPELSAEHSAFANLWYDYTANVIGLDELVYGRGATSGMRRIVADARRNEIIRMLAEMQDGDEWTRASAVAQLIRAYGNSLTWRRDCERARTREKGIERRLLFRLFKLDRHPPKTAQGIRKILSR
ncbi:MAG: hypothetical protein RLO50_14470 [Azospirillaceae bacterium]